MLKEERLMSRLWCWYAKHLRDKHWLYLQFHIWVQFTSVINGLGSHSSWALTSTCLSNYDLLDLCSVHKNLLRDSKPLDKLFHFWLLNFLLLVILFPLLEWLHLGHASANQACNNQVSRTWSKKFGRTEQWGESNKWIALKWRKNLKQKKPHVAITFVSPILETFILISCFWVVMDKLIACLGQIWLWRERTEVCTAIRKGQTGFWTELETHAKLWDSASFY